MADSTYELEYIVVSEASKEATLLQNFIGNLGVVPTIQVSVELFCDNEGMVALTKELWYHDKSRHIDKKYHFIRHRVDEGHFIVKKVSSEENLVDLLIKGLRRIKLVQHARSVGLKDDISFSD